MHYTELAESVKHFKEKEGGREEMSEIVERYINERVEERVEERVKECVEERVNECVEERVKERVEKRKDNFGSKSHEQHEMDVRPGT